MRGFVLAFFGLALSGCLAGRHDPPPNVYVTEPQARPYVEVGQIDAAVLGYGMLGRDARSAAIARLGTRASLYGADAVIGARARGGCSAAGWVVMTLTLLPNCGARATGLGIRWSDVPPGPATTILLSVEAR